MKSKILENPADNFWTTRSSLLNYWTWKIGDKTAKEEFWVTKLSTIAVFYCTFLTNILQNCRCHLIKLVSLSSFSSFEILLLEQLLSLDLISMSVQKSSQSNQNVIKRHRKTTNIKRDNWSWTLTTFRIWNKSLHSRKYGPVLASCKVEWFSEHLNSHRLKYSVHHTGHSLSQGFLTITIRK